MRKNRLLVVEDDAHFRSAVSRAMSLRDFDVSSAPNGSAALAWLSHNPCDLILLDLRLPDMDGMEVLVNARSKHPQVEIVILTAHGTVDTAVQAMHMGAYHFLTKPCEADNLELILRKATERMELLERADVLRDGLAPPNLGEQFVGRSAAHQEILQKIDRVAATDSSVLITGETGVGKELVAKLIHARSPRHLQPFVPVDCANFHDELLQNELFGHEEGAFTGAGQRKYGLFEVASEGTIFLDEVGEVSPRLQVKLLRVLETNSFRPLGGTDETSVDFRLVAATNQDLGKLVERGHFRADLYYRLNAVEIVVPPLRERPEDIEALTRYFLDRFNRRFNKSVDITPEALRIIASHLFPGNVRQLFGTLEQSIMAAEHDVITESHLPTSFRQQARPKASSKGDFVSSIVPLEEVERHYVEFVVKHYGGHRAKAATALGIGERSLYRKLKQWGIS